MNRHGDQLLNKAFATLAYSNFVLLFTIPIVNIIGLYTNTGVNPTLQAWMVGLSISLFAVLVILFCLVGASPSETDAFGYFQFHHGYFNMVVGFLAFLYLLYWAAVIDKASHDGLSIKASYKEEYRFPAGCSEYWMHKETEDMTSTTDQQPAENHVERYWIEIRECMIRNHFCGRISGHDWADMTLEQFYNMDFSSIEVRICNAIMLDILPWWRRIDTRVVV